MMLTNEELEKLAEARSRARQKLAKAINKGNPFSAKLLKNADVDFYLLAPVSGDKFRSGIVIGNIGIPFPEYNANDVYDELNGAKTHTDCVTYVRERDYFEVLFYADYDDGMISNVVTTKDMNEIIDKYEKEMESLRTNCVNYTGEGLLHYIGFSQKVVTF